MLRSCGWVARVHSPISTAGIALLSHDLPLKDICKLVELLQGSHADACMEEVPPLRTI